MSSIAENLQRIKSEIPTDITLVAVSKTKPNAAVLEAYDAGQRDFGENYVQELVDKHEQLPKDIRWHFIGHLQSNKVKYIAPFVHLIHGVDSFKLLQEINKQGLKNNRVIDCLLQLYIAKEETKFGLLFEESEAILNSESFKALKNISIKGFMAMASNTDNSEQIKSEFLSVREFAREASSVFHLPFSTLSYGMSSDYKLALEAGSNMVRIGSTIFGERNYN
ncbi:YggS family pyridoxal phosphate-dependent enzyme [Aurantibacillus circumpalustris]|uniref:YggS family pyridoxal phosphate-dependent enzyme n=1 Tax=Aurantibacillus circumpalustris TaxID=3036359 RepID=UPI00295BD144|nr:YggS family pyridoxal phosphate-dependent enzyme [Aurantibacillus circumpalustris]